MNSRMSNQPLLATAYSRARTTALCKMNRTIRCLALTRLPLLFAGCGMRAVPSRVTLPSEHLRTVLVSDRDTGAAVPSASVTFEMWKQVKIMLDASCRCATVSS